MDTARGGRRFATMVDVVLPVLDEAEALPWVLGRMPAGYRADRRRQRLDRRLRPRSRARLGARVVDEPRPRLRRRLLRRAAGRRRADVVCFMDCDGSLDPRRAAARSSIRSSTATRDLVLGARTPTARGRVAAARAARQPRARRSSCAGAAASRCTTSARCAPRAAPRCSRSDRRPPLRLAAGDGRCAPPRAGWRIGEATVAYHPRAGGRSKVTGTRARHAARRPRHGAVLA